jgi:hypothetical protein
MRCNGISGLSWSAGPHRESPASPGRSAGSGVAQIGRCAAPHWPSRPRASVCMLSCARSNELPRKLEPPLPARAFGSVQSGFVGCTWSMRATALVLDPGRPLDHSEPNRRPLLESHALIPRLRTRGHVSPLCQRTGQFSLSPISSISSSPLVQGFQNIAKP